MRILATLLLFSLGLLGQTSGRGAAKTGDLTSAKKQVQEHLIELIRIDTSNPPGRETRAARYVKSVLDEEGIASEILESAPGRGNLVARLKGNGSKKPVICMGHLDTVGVERDRWTMDPFAGIVKDGYIYGRGASDDKDSVAVCAQVLIEVKRNRVPLDRDVIMIAEAGEEGTAQFGIEFLVDKHWETIAAEYALAEGGWTQVKDGKIQYVAVSTTEKVPRGINLIAHGTSGHGSMPRPDNAVVHLANAVAKVSAIEMPVRLNETTRTFFERLAKISAPPEESVYENVTSPASQEKLRQENYLYYSIQRTSIVPTILKGGFRSNVIPAEATAVLDVRALPDEDMPALMARMKTVIADPSVDVVRTPEGWTRPASPPSRLDTEMFKVLESVQKQMYPDVITLPSMLSGATDMAQLRAKGVQAYGIGGPADEEDRKRVHGNDERISVEGLEKEFEYVYRAIVGIAAGN